MYRDAQSSVLGVNSSPFLENFATHETLPPHLHPALSGCYAPKERLITASCLLNSIANPDLSRLQDLGIHATQAELAALG